MQPINPRMPPKRLQALILSMFIDQNALQSEPLRHKASNHRGAGEDATNQPEDAPKRLQALILMIFIDQTGLHREPLRPKASNHRGQERMQPISPRMPPIGCKH